MQVSARELGPTLVDTLVTGAGQHVNTPILYPPPPPCCHIAYFPFSLRSQRSCNRVRIVFCPERIALDISALDFFGSTSGHLDGIAPGELGGLARDKKRGYATALECRRMAAVGETECPISPGNPPGSPGRHYRYPA